MPSPIDDERQDLLLSCRYGDLPDIQEFVSKFSADALNDVQDDNGNTILHMAAANGHTGEHASTPPLPCISTLERRPVDVLAYLLPLVSPRLLVHKNRAGSTPLHWAAVNQHLDVAHALVQFPTGPGTDMIDIKNGAGRSPLAEAEMAGWEDGARWFVQVMKLDGVKERVEEADQVDPSQAIGVEIQDAEGQVARMTINPNPNQEPSKSLCIVLSLSCSDQAQQIRMYRKSAE